MDEGRKRVLAIVAGILVARHLKSTEDLFDNRGSPHTEAMVAAAIAKAGNVAVSTMSAVRMTVHPAA